MLYNLNKTRQFAAQYNIGTVNYPSLIVQEGGAKDLSHCSGFVNRECVSGDAYAGKHAQAGQIQKSGDSLFAIDCGHSYQVVIAEMKFRCNTKGNCEALASDIVHKTSSTKQLFCGVNFFKDIYVLVDSSQQHLLNTLQRQLIAKKIYKVVNLANLEEKFFKPSSL